MTVSVIIACKKPQPSLYPYQLKINVKDNLSGGESTVKEDTIMAINDSAAYSRAILKVTAQKQSDKLTSNRVYSYQSFSLQDSLGSDVPSKLTSKYKDSVNASFDALLKRLH